MTTVTITLENSLEQSRKELAEESGMTPDEAARDALKRRLSLFRLRKRQTELEGVARRAGYKNEEDLLDDSSSKIRASNAGVTANRSVPR